MLESINLGQQIEEFRQAVNRIFNPPKRHPYMIIRRHSSYGGNFGTHHDWTLYCTTCDIPGIEQPIMVAQSTNWSLVIRLADRHARMHHRGTDT